MLSLENLWHIFSHRSELHLTPCRHSVSGVRLISVEISQNIALLLLLKKVSSEKLRESDIHPISAKTSAPQFQPIDRKKRKGKRVEDYSRDRAA